MASCWIPHLLALEVSTTTRQAQGGPRSSAADPSFLGRSSHPWRAPQARHRCRPDFGCQVHGPRPAPPSEGWRTFLLNHADGIASIDLFVVPTISFRDQRLRRLNTMPWPELEQERLLQNLVCSLDSWL